MFSHFTKFLDKTSNVSNITNDKGRGQSIRSEPHPSVVLALLHCPCFCRPGEFLLKRESGWPLGDHRPLHSTCRAALCLRGPWGHWVPRRLSPGRLWSAWCQRVKGVRVKGLRMFLAFPHTATPACMSPFKTGSRRGKVRQPWWLFYQRKGKFPPKAPAGA